MSRVIQGKNVAISFNLGVGSLAIVCAQSFNISHTAQLIETTTLSSGRYRDYEGQSIDWTLNVGTILELDSAFNTGLDLLAALVAFQKIPFVLVFTDDLSGTFSLSGTVICESSDIAGGTGQLVGSNLSLKGCGKIPEIDNAGGDPGTNETLLTRFYTATGGETELSNPDYIGAQMIEVIRNGSGLLIITIGTPVLDEVKFNDSTGTLTFGYALGADEWVQTVYET